jgi:hypothetical protein
VLVKALKTVGALLAFSALLWFFVAKFSAADLRLECSGEITTNDGTKKATVFLKLQRYRWWVNLWNDSYGSAWLELPNQTADYYGDIREAGDFLSFWDSGKHSGGYFSTLSNALTVEFPSHGRFAGSCNQVKQ